MTITPPDRRLMFALMALVLFCPAILYGQSADEGQSSLPPGRAAAMADYRRALAEYQSAQASYDAAAGTYWIRIAERRHLRASKRSNKEPLAIGDYVLAQPPVYTGPAKPRDPSKPEEPPEAPPYVPLVADFLAAARAEFNFVPRMPQSESEFKHAYAKVALAAGLTADQIVRIYGFEAGGNGGYDIEAGLEHDKHARAITTALGYNQLLATNTVEILAESGRGFLQVLKARAAQLPDGEGRAFDDKITIVRRMVGFALSVPDDWKEHEALSKTQKGLGVHALNLDVDVGPLLQTQKLLDSVIFARRMGLSRTLTAAELEMMNLTGDGNGFDMITMPYAWRDQVPTSNFFARGGYSRNPVAQRNNVVGRLIASTAARMDEEVKKQGAKELAAALH